MNMRRKHFGTVLDHILLVSFTIVMSAPLGLVFWNAGKTGGLSARGQDAVTSMDGYLENLAFFRDLAANTKAADFSWMLSSSMFLALGIATVTTVVAFLAAYAMTRFPGRIPKICFGITVATLLFPVEARILSTFDVAADLGLIDTWPGAILPVLPLALATLVFRQHLKLIPEEIFEAALMDGAGAIRILRDFLVPLSKAPIGAVFLISFVFGWNQYLWPLIISVDDHIYPLMRGLNLVVTGSGPGLVVASVSMLPPLLLVLGFLRLMTQLTAIRS